MNWNEEADARIKREFQANEDLERFRAVLMLADFKVKRVHKLVNGYLGWSQEIAVPWYLFETDVGLIEMGWRKRVISVNWESTGLKWVRPVDHDVTKHEHYFHAYGYQKLLEYMYLLRAAFLTTDDKPATVEAR